MFLQIAQVLQDILFLFSSQHQVHRFDVGHRIGLQLCIAACHHHEGTRMLFHQPMDGLAALLVGHLGHRAGIHHTDVRLLALTGRAHSRFPQRPADGRRLRKVQLAAQRIINRCLVLEYIGINHKSSYSCIGHKGTHYYSNSLLSVHLPRLRPLFAGLLRRRHKKNIKKVGVSRTTYPKSLYLCSVLIKQLIVLRF